MRGNVGAPNYDPVTDGLAAVPRIGTMTADPWCMSWRADPYARAIADRHYNRQSVGATQFVPPGRCLVLTTTGALWITSWPFAKYVKHDWPGAWINSAFRNERQDLHLSSDLIRAAVAATRSHFGVPPELGMVSFIDLTKVRHKRDPGRCYRKAGFRPVGYTKGGLLALQLLPEDMPEPDMPAGVQRSLWMEAS